MTQHLMDALIATLHVFISELFRRCPGCRKFHWTLFGLHLHVSQSPKCDLLFKPEWASEWYFRTIQRHSCDYCHEYFGGYRWFRQFRTLDQHLQKSPACLMSHIHDS